MNAALAAEGLEPSALAWFHWGTRDMESAINDLVDASPDVILLVANAPEGLVIAKLMASKPSEDRIPIISHWGITGGNFFDQTKDVLDDIDLSFLQTFSFVKPPFPDRAEKIVAAYVKRYPDATDASSIFAPTGTAHAYDMIYLLALAIEKAGTTDRHSIRNAMENLGEYKGLVRDYSPPFSAGQHDALDVSDFSLSRYDENGVIVPLK
jgi:branched-chain amino acid transport system substrate-binding protein